MPPTRTRAFLGLGANEDDPEQKLQAAVRALDGEAIRFASLARTRRTPYVGAGGTPVDTEPAVLNTVADVQTTLSARALLDRMQAVERELGRIRDGRTTRAVDLDLLTYGDEISDDPALTLPHPRSTTRGFVLTPWSEIAPLVAVPSEAGTFPVVTHLARWRRTRMRGQGVVHGELGIPSRHGACTLLRDRQELASWRNDVRGTVGVVPTMGALHEGHATLVRRAAAECDHALATIFVNPLQFDDAGDLERYPRTLDADCEVLRHAGASAVYVPTRDDLYAADFTTHVVPSVLSDLFEGARRPGHFQGVTTVVLKLWMRTRPDRAYFSRKDAQQLAIVRRMARDLDLPGDVVPCLIVREPDGLARSSRNRFLRDTERAMAEHFPRTLEQLAFAVARSDGRGLAELCARARKALADVGHDPDYLTIVDPDSFAPLEHLSEGPALAVAAWPVGQIRLLDNCWVAAPH